MNLTKTQNMSKVRPATTDKHDFTKEKFPTRENHASYALRTKNSLRGRQCKKINNR